jgi:hypothetical protein
MIRMTAVALMSIGLAACAAGQQMAATPNPERETQWLNRVSGAMPRCAYSQMAAAKVSYDDAAQRCSCGYRAIFRSLDDRSASLFAAMIAKDDSLAGTPPTAAEKQSLTSALSRAEGPMRQCGMLDPGA